MSGPAHLPADAIADTRTRVLLAVQELAASELVVTIPAICDLVGRSRGIVHLHLCELYSHGLVDWQDGRNGTIRPTCERVAL